MSTPSRHAVIPTRIDPHVKVTEAIIARWSEQDLLDALVWPTPMHALAIEDFEALRDAWLAGWTFLDRPLLATVDTGGAHPVLLHLSNLR